MICSVHKLIFSFFVVILTGSLGYSQDGFFLPANVASEKIPFQLVNNLVVIPVEINGTPLSFILDTGVRTSILFGIEQNDSIQMRNVSPIKIKGLGEGDAVDALKSEGNTFRVGEAVDFSHTLYIVFDASLNFSPRMGIPIHGILGYEFYRQFVVETNYSSKRLSFYRPKDYNYKKCKNCASFDLVFYNDKPHIDVEAKALGQSFPLTVLVDSGSSDALWIFNPLRCISEVEKNYFIDFLGLGLSGHIYGKRTRIQELSLGNYVLNQVNTAAPDQEDIDNAKMYVDRDGSLGGNVLKRFKVIMDYPGKRMTLKKSSLFGEPFYYNMSGLTLEQGDSELIQGSKKIINNPLSYTESDQNAFAFGIIRTTEFSWEWASKLMVVDVRPDSPAAEVGLYKGDEILMINGKPAHQYKLYEITDLFSSREGKKINLEILRNGLIMKKAFVLRKMI
ncbi:aspartyl protease family protein [Aureitalea marina]|uniref:aspartyl protease family protein n=1 Tax=Aureitalea marina TaxID=930804 RepID=UPI000CF2CCED|nr:aspartyl protease family protein [Aureitalea marina]